jgi:hypothetical protein
MDLDIPSAVGELKPGHQNLGLQFELSALQEFGGVGRCICHTNYGCERRNYRSWSKQVKGSFTKRQT